MAHVGVGMMVLGENSTKQRHVQQDTTGKRCWIPSCKHTGEVMKSALGENNVGRYVSE
jgi:hypothetical protein